MHVARIAKPVDHRLQVLKLLPPDKAKLAREIKNAGGQVPESLRPTNLGIFNLGKATSNVAAKRNAKERAAEVARQHKCTVRSVNRAQRFWLAYIAPEVPK